LFANCRPVHPGTSAERGCNPDNDQYPLTVDRSGWIWSVWNRRCIIACQGDGIPPESLQLPRLTTAERLMMPTSRAGRRPP